MKRLFTFLALMLCAGSLQAQLSFSGNLSFSANVSFDISTNGGGGGGGGDITTGLVGWWKLDEGSGTTATDSSGNGNDGTEASSGGYITGQIGPFALDTTTSSTVTIADSASVKPTHMTVACWVNGGGSFPDPRPFISHDHDIGTGYAYELSANDATGTHTGEFIFAVQGVVAHSPYASYVTGWHHLAGTYDGTNLKLYIDGVLVSTVSSSADPNYVVAPSTYPLKFSLNRSLDDARLYNRALTQSDITTLYAFR